MMPLLLPWHLLASLLPRGRGVFVSRERLLFCGSGLPLSLHCVCLVLAEREIKLTSELSVSSSTDVYCSSVPLINKNN